MPSNWHPRVLRGGKPPKLPPNWQRYRRPRWPSFGWGEVRLMALGGVFLGLASMFVPAPTEVRVIDGDTFDYRGMRIRVADIDTPEHDGRCAYETALAAQATRRMRELLNEGPFELRALASGRDEDQYGRKLRIVTRGGRSLGDQLVAEGLARTWSGRRELWC